MEVITLKEACRHYLMRWQKDLKSLVANCDYPALVKKIKVKDNKVIGVVIRK